MDENKKHFCVKSYWRPVMAWQYTFVCLFDFVILPLVLAYLARGDISQISSWEPLTLRSGGLYHVAMGAIVGVSAWSRGQEKIRTAVMENLPLK